MHYPTSARIAACLAATSLLAGCVTNEEDGTPDGWEPIVPDEVPEIAAMVPPEVAADGVLNVAANPPFAPFEFKNSRGDIVGVEMDLARAVAGVMGMDFRVDDMDFALILPAVTAGSLDAGASGFTDNAERRESFDFVDFLYAGVQWAAQPGSGVDPSDPCGLTVSVQRTTVSETDDVRPKSEACEAAGKDPLTVLAFDTADNAALAALVGRADAYSADSPVTAWAVERSDGELEMVGEMFDAAPYGFAVPKGSQLANAMAAAMQYLIDTGDYARILNQWNIDTGLLDQALINEQPAGGL
ncbi:ABC transporter substrate-binding protein [Corynebacterium ureicelerivorans]|uniref:ABC transporter substrate-binding protein n=1 Tax=Corynebacterium ureicelerivorans TaxID=401472 RepID=UPI00264D7692|nr:ABC transporter substrate-binding protein [Corynebacterium ureicelerivorans]MDN8604440.1 ABC transporter substrate-binding protein [Corynebacterium ureicelerivorans]